MRRRRLTEQLGPDLVLESRTVMKNSIHDAIRELKAALDIEPGHAGARQQICQLHRLLGTLN